MSWPGTGVHTDSLTVLYHLKGKRYLTTRGILNSGINKVLRIALGMDNPVNSGKRNRLTTKYKRWLHKPLGPYYEKRGDDECQSLYAVEL